MTYKEYSDQRQQEFNALPIFYAFSNKQFEEAMNFVENTDMKIILETIAGERTDYPMEMAKKYYEQYENAQKIVASARKAAMEKYRERKTEMEH